MKQLYLFISFLLLFNCFVFSQKNELPPNPKSGETYVRCLENGKFSEWVLVDSELKEIHKDSKKFNALQIKLLNLGYDVDVNGKLDKKTIDAYNQNLRDEKKRLRRQSKLNRKKRKV